MRSPRCDCVALFALALLSVSAAPAADGRPNVLWITSEDNGPHLGAYGDDYANTPNLDALAHRGMIYLHCWSNAPVCAPARTAIISGMYPPSTGSQHMRSMVRLPDGFKMYPQYLREAGYYCTNNSKEDYNLAKPSQVWDESSGRAHWKNRAEGQPFFAIFNIATTHESQIRKRPHKAVHDASQVRVPAYHPDVPEVRRDWAQYYDKLTEMDAQAGRHLRELEEAGLAEETIVFYYGDHGSGMPRSKRWPYNSGLHVPLIVYVPSKFRELAGEDYTPGGKSERLVSFVDLAPTLLSLAGIEPPEHMQGSAFLGPHAAAPREYVYGFRGRMDERYDMVRSVRDRRYVYIRNFMPHEPYGQHVSYMFETPTTRAWKDLYDAGKLNEAQAHFWHTKPPEELYDLENDPDEVHNLADSAEHREILERFRKAQHEWILDIRDLGFLPEHEIHTRSTGTMPYEMSHDPQQYSLERILQTADLASSLKRGAVPALTQALADRDSAVRYWAALGLLMRAEEAVNAAAEALAAALEDPAPTVRVTAARALAQFGGPDRREQALDVLVRAADLRENSVSVAILALDALDELDERAEPVRDRIANLPAEVPGIEGRMRSYVPRLIEKTLADLPESAP